jgi:hypothetical protein
VKVTVDWTKVAATFLRFTAPAFAVAFLITTALVALSPVPDWEFYSRLVVMKLAVWAALGGTYVIAAAIYYFCAALISSAGRTYRSPASGVASVESARLRLR